MAKNTQPVLKRCRTLGVSPAVMGYSKTSNKNPGGQRRAKKSEYALQLTEKQKVKFVYGILEKQFRMYYEKAARAEGNTGEVLLSLIERRLDNVIYRLGIAKTRRMARQIIVHGHILVNGKKVDIASYRVKPDDVVSVKEKSRNMALVLEAQQSGERDVPDYLELGDRGFSVRYVRVPELADVPFPVKMEPNLVVEYYSS